MLLLLEETSVKRDAHFQETHHLASSSLSALGHIMNIILVNLDEGLDTIKLREFLSDTGKLVTLWRIRYIDFRLFDQWYFALR